MLFTILCRAEMPSTFTRQKFSLLAVAMSPKQSETIKAQEKRAWICEDQISELGDQDVLALEGTACQFSCAAFWETYLLLSRDAFVALVWPK